MAEPPQETIHEEEEEEDEEEEGDENEEEGEENLEEEEAQIEEEEKFVSIFEILDAPRELPEPVELTIEHIKQIQSELGIIILCWPDIKNPYFEGRVNFPEEYTKNTEKEKFLLLYTENFRRQFVDKFPHRKPLLLAAPNEVGLMKMVCTTLRPTKLPHKEIDSAEKCSSFVGDQLLFEPLPAPTLLPNRLYSPNTVFLRQSGTSFEIANALCSLLIGLGYDAYMISGYAIQDVTLKIMTRINSPFPPEEEEEKEEVKQTIGTKYVLKPPKDLRSQFLLYMQQREIDKVLKAEQDAKEAEERRLEELEKPPFDEINGQRLHAWVLLVAGTKEIETTVFVEASTGTWYPLTSSFYCGIESVWNNTNYWVNLQDCSEGLDKLDFDFSNVEYWEHLIIGEPAKYRETAITEDMEEEEIKLIKIEEEKHLDIPIPWSLPVYLSPQVLSERFPNGIKKTWYKRTMVEQYAPYIQQDGLVTRICRYHDLECSPSELYSVEERYSNRTDNLVKIISDCNTGEVTEYFKRGGREDAVKRHIYKSGFNTSVECERVIEFYHEARHDGLKKLDFDALFIIEHYIKPENLIHFRHTNFARRGHPPPGILEGTRRIVIKVVEKHNRDETKPPSEDVAVREFALVERELHIKYHYEDGKVTASTRDFTKPPIEEMGDQLKFNPELTVGYQSEVGAKPPRQLKLFRLLEELLQEEETTLYHVRELEDQIVEFLKLRHFEMAYPKLSISLFDRVHNTEHRKGMLEREQKEKEYKAREVEDEIDCLSPYISRLGSPIKLTKMQAAQAREWCLFEFKQMLVDRANDIQRQFEQETAKLSARQNWFLDVQDTLKSDEETEYFDEVNQSMFLLHTMEMRLARHRDLSPYRYEALSNYLRMDPRLAVLFK